MVIYPIRHLYFPVHLSLRAFGRYPVSFLIKFTCLIIVPAQFSVEVIYINQNFLGRINILTRSMLFFMEN